MTWMAKVISSILLATGLVVFELAGDEMSAQASGPVDDYSLALRGNPTFNNVMVIPYASSFSVELWFKADNIPNAGTGIVAQGASSGARYLISLRPDASITLYAFSSGILNSGAGLVQAGAWHHVAFVHSPGLSEMFFDGQLVATKNDYPSSDWNNRFYLGSDWSGQYDFDGEIDQFKVWWSALNPNQVEASMHAWRVPPSIPSADLRVHYDFNDQDPRRVTSTTSVGELSFASDLTYSQVATETTLSGGTERVVTFPRTYLTSHGGWTSPSGVTDYQYLIVAGGGGGGAWVGGGGGAGGFDQGTTTLAAGSSIAVQVGQGGAGAYFKDNDIYFGADGYTSKSNTNGQDSKLGSLVVPGGGAGANHGFTAAQNGGSGGGGSIPDHTVGGLAVSNGDFGNAGGKGADDNPIASGQPHATGGGGGAGAVGQGAVSATQSGDGGPGETTSIISTSLATTLGVGKVDGTNVYFAGGGGGSLHGNGSTTGYIRAEGGLGGGGAGTVSNGAYSASQIAESGAPNTGGGGGGAANNINRESIGGSGGSGVVILRYTYTAPGDVTNFNASTRLVDADSDADSVTLAWTSPALASPAVTSYQIDYSTNNLVWTTGPSVSGGVTSTTINGLTDGETYFFRIKAISDAGSSANYATATSVPVSTIDRALNFNGTNTTAIGTGSLIQKNAFTMEAWVKPDSLPNLYNAIFAQGQGGADTIQNRFYLGLKNDSGAYAIHVGRHDGVSGAADFGIANPIGQWSHIAVTVEGTAVKTYLNGTLIGTATLPDTEIDEGFAIGSDDIGDRDKFDGLIDQVKIWDGVLDQDEIKLSMHTWGSAQGIDNSLRAHWDMNDSSNTTKLLDQQGSYDLTLNSVSSNEFNALVTFDTSTYSDYGQFAFERSYLTQPGWTAPFEIKRAQLVVVGAGGGGGENVGFGGAGGGAYVLTNQSIPAGASGTVEVGLGGLGGRYAISNANDSSTPDPRRDGDDGQSSQTTISGATITAFGGAGGDTFWSDDICGGSGAVTAVATGGSSQGTGGSAFSGASGGAGNYAAAGGAGGDGYEISIAGTTHRFGAGGGGGGWSNTLPGGAGGQTGGGDGGSSNSQFGKNGIAGTGSGGGGGYIICQPGGSGGSGIVLLTVPLKPAAPTINSATATATSLTIDFSEAASGAEPETYEYTLNGTNWVALSSAEVAATSFTLTGLNTETSYTVQLRAKSTVNSVSYDGPAATATTTTGIVASAPQNLVLESGNTSVNLSWTAPLQSGTPITDYLIEYQLRGANSWSTFADGVSTATSASVTGLSANSTYNFRVSAVTSEGTGTASDVRTTITISGLISLLDASNSVSYSGTGTSWFDTTGNGNSATGINAPIFNGSSQGFELNGNDQYFTYGDPTKFNYYPALPYTFVVEFSPSNLSSSAQALWSRVNTGVKGAYFYRVRDSGISIGRNVSPWESARFGEIINEGKYVAAYTFDGSNATLFIDGIQVHTETWNPLPYGANIESLLGAELSNNVPVNLFDGLIYSAAIFDEAIDATQALALAQQFDAAPAAPTIDSITASSQSLSVSFTPGTNDGTSLKTYQYSTDGGTTWRNRDTGTTASPLVISTTSGANTALVNGTSYDIKIRAVNTLSGAASTTVSATPNAAGLVPLFDTPVSSLGGFSVNITNYDASYDWSATATAGSASIDSNGVVTVTGLTQGQQSEVTVQTSKTGFFSASNSVTGSAFVTYTISFNANDSDSGSPPASQTKIAGVDLTLTASLGTLQKSNHTFLTWNTEPDRSGQDYAPGGTLSVDADEVLYAIWLPNVVLDNPGSGLTAVAYSAYSLGLTASDGTAPYTFSVTAGSLPSGLTLSSGGTISGTPTTPGTYNFTVTVTDSSSTPVTDSLALQITVSAAVLENIAAPTVNATGGTLKSLDVSWVQVANASSYVLKVYNSDGTNELRNISIASSASSFVVNESSFPLIEDNTTYLISLTAVGTGSYATSTESATVAGRTLAAFTVSFNANGADNGSAPGDLTKIEGVDQSIVGNTGTLELEGYIFSGWNTQADGEGTNYEAGDPYQIDADVELFAKWVPGVFTVTYIYNGADGGNSTTSETYTVGDPALTLPVPTRDGYTFGGWFDNPQLTGTALGATYTPTADVDLYAAWIGNTYSILYNYNGADSGNSVTNSSYTSGLTQVTLPTPGRTGYNFLGWFERGDLTGTAVSSPYSTSQNRTLHAKWQAIQYTVTYNKNLVISGNTVTATGTVPVDSDTYTIGETVPILANSGPVSRLGYTFLGWVTNEDGTGTPLQSGQTLTMGSANINLYPQWQANTYTISYNLNGGTGSLVGAPTSFTVGNSNETLPSSGFTKTGFTFGGWSKTQGGNQTPYSFSTFADVTLYAIWNIKSINYSFSQGAAASETIAGWPADSAANFATEITLPDLIGTTVTLGGSSYLFFGWEYSGSTYDSGDTYVLGETEPTFIAQWVELFDVRYGFAGGTHSQSGNQDSVCIGTVGSPRTPALCVDGETIQLRTAPERAGYDFLGWQVQDSTADVKRAGEFHQVSADGYLFYAKWDPIDYVFSFNSVGGSNNFADTQGNIGQLLTLPDPGFKQHYSFAGWSADQGATLYAKGSQFLIGTQDESFEAQWTPNVYNVVFDWQGGVGTPTPDASYTWDTGDLPLPVQGDMVRDGFEFAGWSTSPGGTVVTSFRPTSDDVLYAVWTDGSYQLTFDPKGGQLDSLVSNVPRLGDIELPTPVRPGFVFTGWFDAATLGNKVADGGEVISPAASRTLYGRWVQRSLFGVDEATLETGTTFTASDAVAIDTTLAHPASGTSARVEIPTGTLPAGTQVQIRYYRDTSRQEELISDQNSYVFSVLVSWLYGSGDSATVPETNSGKSIKLTLTNPAIKAGAIVYMVIGDQVTELTRATVDGSVVVELTEDPEIVLALVAPDAPRNVAAEAGDAQVTVTWDAPVWDGGSEITSYTVTANTGETCTWTSGPLTCDVTGLTNDTPYTFSVVATNAIGDSSPSTVSTSVTPAETLYTATFDSNGGSAVTGVTFTASSTIAEPANPTRSGYTFLGWTTTKDDASTLVTFPFDPAQDAGITLFALWERNPVVVTPNPQEPGPAAGLPVVAGETKAWTKRIDSNTVKVYIKFPEMAKNYQIRIQKDNGEYVRLMSKTINSTADADLSVVGEWYYIVRTIELPGEGRYRIEILEDGERITLNGKDRPVVYSYINAI